MKEKYKFAKCKTFKDLKEGQTIYKIERSDPDKHIPVIIEKIEKSGMYYGSNGLYIKFSDGKDVYTESNSSWMWAGYGDRKGTISFDIVYSVSTENDDTKIYRDYWETYK